MDEFIRFTESDILTHDGSVRHEQAIEKDQSEYEKYRLQLNEQLSPVETHFLEAIAETKKLQKKNK